MESRRVSIFDTTLRDGEQCPGATMTHQEKMTVAAQLEKLRVDVIEAGFPVASEDDFKAVKEIADRSSYSTIAGLARAIDRDIDRTWDAIRGARRPRIHTFMSSSDIQLKYQFKKTKAQALDMVKAAVKRASDYCDDVEFSPMDATRSDPDFLYRIIGCAIDRGASVINIPDT
ncbi:MAG: 2-isopropylmalate synthase, partial [Candidatus Micrarchaeota archaeon]|nr:2-isopropylmalate synthase [Candidatus Micrarchaeota archaeon]